MDYPISYIQYLVQFHATRDFFECHELLEEYWKENPNDGLGGTWVGLIQVAVGQYHHRRGNRSGAEKMYLSAIHKLKDANNKQLGINVTKLIEEIKDLLDRIEQYQDLTFEITDQKLLEYCLAETKAMNLLWNISSSEVDSSIIHRHKLRDRSEVISAREQAIINKKRQS